MGLKAGIDFDIVLTISGTEYGCMLYGPRAFRKIDVNEFAARVTTGAPVYSDDDIYSVAWQEDWRHGAGFPWYSDEFGYAYAGDHVDTRRQGVVQLATKLTSVDASGKAVNRYMDYNVDVSSSPTDVVMAACAGTGGVRWSANGTSWSANADLDADETDESVNDLLDAGGYIFATPDGASERMYKLAEAADPASAWSAAGNAGNPPNGFEWLAKGGGYLWGSEAGTNYLHIAASADGSDWEGDGTSDAAVITVGAEDTPITSLCWWNNNMYVGKTDSLYIVLDDLSGARKVFDAADRKHADNFKYMAVGVDGALYFSVYDRVYRWVGRTPIDITPGTWGEFPAGGGYAGGTKPPYVSYILFHSMARIGSDIVVVGRTSDTSWEEHILFWTGSGWHKLYAPITSGTYQIYAIGQSLNTTRTYVSVGGTTTTTYAIKMRSGSDLPYDDYPTTGNHYLYLSRISLGLLDIPKYLKSLKLRGFNLNSTQTIAWHYQIDDNGSWYSLGTQNTAPYQAIDFASTATCKTVQPRANLSTSTGGQTPYLDAYALKLLARPTTVYGYSLTLKVGDKIPDLRDRTGYTPTGRELLSALESARESPSPITLDTPLESDITCVVTALAQIGLEYDKEDSPYMIVQLSLTAA